MCCALLSLLTSMGVSNDIPSIQRVLCCAPTNVAGREIAKRFYKQFLHQGQMNDQQSKGFKSNPNSSTQFASYIGVEPLDLSHLLLVGTEGDIIPFGMEKEGEILRLQANEDQADEMENEIEPGAGEQIIPGYEVQDEDINEDGLLIKDRSQPTGDHSLSFIYQDHRARRLNILFCQLNHELLKLRSIGLFDQNFFRVVSRQHPNTPIWPHDELVVRCKSFVQRWLKSAQRMMDLLNQSFDLPEFGPTNEMAGFFISTQTGRVSLKATAMKFIESIEWLQMDLDKLRLDGRRCVNITDLLNDGIIFDAVPVISHRNMIGKAGQLLQRSISEWLLCCSDRHWLSSLLLLNARLIFSTVSCAARSNVIQSEAMIREMQRNRRRTRNVKQLSRTGKEIQVDPAVFRIYPISSVVIDEAAQLVEAFVPIVFSISLQRLFLIGDDNQLPAVVTSPAAKMRQFHRSLFQRLVVCHKWPVNLLSVQYRMHPNISAFSNVQFYDSRIEDAQSVRNRSQPLWSSTPAAIDGLTLAPQPHHQIFDRAFTFVNLHSGLEGSGEEKDHLSSFYNKLEEDAIIQLLHQLEKRIRSCLNGSTAHPALPITAGVIAPYRRQSLNLQRAIASHFPNAASDSVFRVRCSTVDAFQGQECDAIFFSATRSNRQGVMGFVDNENRLNVAMTRAKQLLVVVADRATVTKRSNLWRALHAHAQGVAQHRSLYSIDDLSERKEDEDEAEVKQNEAIQPTVRLVEDYSASPANGNVVDAHNLKELKNILNHVNECLSAFQSLTSRRNNRSSDVLQPGVGKVRFHVQISDSAMTTWRQMQPSDQEKIFTRCIYELICGRFKVKQLQQIHNRRIQSGMDGIHHSLIQRLAGIVHEERIDRFYIVWMIDLDRSEEYTHQRIKIWTIATDLATVKGTLKRVYLELNRWSDERLNRVRIDFTDVSHRERLEWSSNDDKKMVWLKAQENSISQASSSSSSSTSSSSSSATSFDSSSSSSSSSSLPSSMSSDYASSKFYTLSSELVTVLLDPEKKDFEADFDLQYEEAKVANHKGGLIILGRR